MKNDYIKKEPTKTEKMIYEMVMAQQGMERALWSNSSVLMALAILLDVKAEKIADLLVDGDEQIKEFSKKVNDAIKVKEDVKHKDHKHTEGKIEDLAV